MFFRWFMFLTVVQPLVTLVQTDPLKNVLDQPTIWVARVSINHAEVDYHSSNFATVDGGNLIKESMAPDGKEFIISRRVSSVQLLCNASTPVLWSFLNAKYDFEDLNYNIRLGTARISQNVSDPTNDVFQASLQIRMESNEGTGRYTCETTNGSGPSANISIFWEGKSTKSLVLAGRLLQISITENTTNLLLPCYVSHKTATVSIQKELGEAEGFQPLPSTITFEFSPIEGFHLSFRKWSHAIGRYRCQSGGDVMEILVKKSEEKACFESGCRKKIMTPGTSFYVNDTSETVVCCGQRGPLLTRMISRGCRNPSECRMNEQRMHDMTGNVENYGNGSCVWDALYKGDGIVLARCFGEGIDVFNYVYLPLSALVIPGPPSQPVFDWTKLNPKRMVKLSLSSQAPHYDREDAVVVCEASPIYFSDGIKIAGKWSNGSVIFLETIDYGDSKAGASITLCVDFTEVLCYAPVWNSSEWIQTKISIDVKPSRIPAIVGETEETLTFPINATGKRLTCVAEGEPMARFTWSKDGTFLWGLVKEEENGSSVVLLDKISTGSGGVYTCTAKNTIGQAEKRFYVAVQVPDHPQTSHSSWIVGFTVVASLFVLALGVIGFLWRRLEITNRIIAYLTRDHFRDVANTS